MHSSHAIFSGGPVHPQFYPRSAFSESGRHVSPAHRIDCLQCLRTPREEGSLSRRQLVLSTGIILGEPLSRITQVARAEVTSAKLQEFVDTQKGFKLFVPVAREMVGKAGADALFRNPHAKSTTVGVTVYPSRVMSTQDFGTLDEAEKKLVAAEAAKDGFIDLQMLEKRSRLGEKGALFYTFNYELLSTRGRKRILTAVSIFTKKLFIATGTYKCAKSSCDVDQSELEIESLRESIDSFDILL